jgi:hypothetical protein
MVVARMATSKRGPAGGRGRERHGVTAHSRTAIATTRVSARGWGRRAGTREATVLAKSGDAFRWRLPLLPSCVLENVSVPREIVGHFRCGPESCSSELRALGDAWSLEDTLSRAFGRGFDSPRFHHLKLATSRTSRSAAGRLPSPGDRAMNRRPAPINRSAARNCVERSRRRGGASPPSRPRSEANTPEPVADASATAHAPKGPAVR